MSRSRGWLALGIVSALAATAAYAAVVLAPGSDGAPAPDVSLEDAGALALPTPRPRRPRSDERPDILLFTIDTLRADRLSSYGNDRPTSPTMDALAARGTRFTRAYSTSSWTLPACASLVSGVFAAEHGVLHSALSDAETAAQDRLSLALPSLPARLHDAGYRTVGVTANTHLLAEAGFGRGFDEYECTSFGNTERARPAVWRRLDALRDGDRPYFFWVHVTDPHAAYTPRDPQFSQWWGATRPRHPRLDRSVYLAGVQPVFEAEGISTEEGLEYVNTAYDSEIRAVDDMLRDLIAELDDGHLVVMLTADHGEELNDHRHMGHGTTLFEEVVRVPMILSVPGQSPSVVETPVSIVDVFPTLAELAGVGTEGLAGASLVPTTRGEPLVTTREVVMESGRRQTLQGIVDERWALAERTEPHPITVLFDLVADPTEHHEIASEHPDVAAGLSERLHATLAAARSRRPEVESARIELPDEIREHLRALGYAP